MTDQLLSTMTVQAAVDRIGNHDHCQAGGAIGMSGALAAALAQATANATRVEQPDAAQDAAAQAMQERMGHIRAGLLHLADQDANAILAFVAMEERGEALAGYALLCRGPQQMADLAIDAAQAMQA
ncbi:MAG: cyclodeaminase/cyclohydrolase family protein, partial [Caldilinea sp.]|nr:cyclodeaminase/cyclohydrolase family protein [Caldilinea sp.]